MRKAQVERNLQNRMTQAYIRYYRVVEEATQDDDTNARDASLTLALGELRGGVGQLRALATEIGANIHPPQVAKARAQRAVFT